MNIQFSYPAVIEFDGEAFQVHFPDIENAFTYGVTLPEAIHNAEDLLGTMLVSMVKAGEPLPVASVAVNCRYQIAPFPEVAAPLALFLLRKQQGKTITEVAKLLTMTKQRYSDIEKGKNLTLKTLHKAAAALGASTQIAITAF